MKNKKGVSPVIVTVLLVAIVLVLAAIIFIWAKSFVQEDVQKFNQPASTICSEVNLAISSDATGLKIVNNGDRVPVNKIELVVNNNGNKNIVDYPDAIDLQPQSSTTIDISSYGDVIGIIPVLLGTKGGQQTDYVCDKNEIDLSS